MFGDDGQKVADQGIVIRFDECFHPFSDSIKGENEIDRELIRVAKITSI